MNEVTQGPLLHIVSELIRKRGPMPFAAFMSLALYHPQHGYYASGHRRTGWHGHFITSPELDPAFGALWARGLEQIWRACGRPERFDVIEVGPGEGGFAVALLGGAAEPFKDAIAYRSIERVPALEQRQRDLLAGLGEVEWSSSIQEAPPVTAGVVFANEVIDNLPVHVVERRGGELLEVCVTEKDGALVSVPLPARSPELEGFLQRCGLRLPEGGRAEVGLAAESFIQQAAGAIESGAVIVVDYGLTAPELTTREAGTLAAYSESGADDRVLDNPGSRDITSHANWSALGHAARRAELAPAGPMTQRSVLKALGINDMDERLRSEQHAALARGSGSDAIAALSRRQALGALIDPRGLGGLEVLLAAKGIEVPAFMRPA